MQLRNFQFNITEPLASTVHGRKKIREQGISFPLKLAKDLKLLSTFPRFITKKKYNQ